MAAKCSMQSADCKSAETLVFSGFKLFMVFSGGFEVFMVFWNTIFSLAVMQFLWVLVLEIKRLRHCVSATHRKALIQMRVSTGLARDRS